MVKNNWHLMKLVCKAVPGSALIFGGASAFETWFQKEYKYLSDVVLYEMLNGMIFRKAANVELECYEDTEFYNRYTLAIKETEVRIASVLQNTANILCAGVAVIIVMWNMFLIDHFVTLFVISPLIGNFVFGRLVNQVVYRRDKAAIPGKRKMDYGQ